MINNNSIFVITTKEEGVVFDIKFDGSLYWLRRGKLTQAKTDPDLNLALAKAIKTIYELHNSLKIKHEKTKTKTKKAPSRKASPKQKEKPQKPLF